MMKKHFLIFSFLIVAFSLNAQTVSPTKKAKSKKIDTVKTEVVEVITKYNPKIADANKIKKNPVLKLLQTSEKKKLKYTIFSAPVASTFIPKSGVIKGIDVGVRERIYDNYLALGYGNYSTPYVEAFIHSQTRFNSEFGAFIKYNAAFQDIENTVLNSTFSNLNTNLFYKKEERYFDWRVDLSTENNTYNWYGLSNNIFIANTLASIEEQQNYNYFKANGAIDFLDSYFDDADLSISFFSDAFSSKEFLIDLNTSLDLPIDFIDRSLNNLKVNTGFEYLSGQFKSDYSAQNRLNYSLFTIRLNPEYKDNFGGFSLQLGTKLAASFDAENSTNQVLIYPDVKIETPIIKEHLNLYTGVTGDLHTNTFKQFSENNPFISPTLFITQTSEKYNAFVGFNGKISNSFSYNISGNFKEEEDKPFFISNNSKSDGINTSLGGTTLLGYEYGNSFNVVYDDVKTVTFFGEIEYDVTKNLLLSANFQFDNFTTSNEQEAWNLPTTQTSLSAKYKTNKWYATSHIFYVGERKDVSYNSTYPTSNFSTVSVSSFVDINLNGGYHINNKFSAFVKLNNILNNQYERFSNFNVQGFQVLGGISYKFDF